MTQPHDHSAPFYDDMIRSGKYLTSKGYVVFTKSKDDPACVRVSIGGKDGIGWYCTFRGDFQDAKKALKIILDAMENELVISDFSIPSQR